jgi:conserved hypothetical protein TIGR02594
MSQPIWLQHAEREIGVTEIPGEVHEDRILQYHKCTSLKATDDETPWCSAFVNWCMERAGIKGTNSAAARSWLDWGQVLDTPREGCIAIFKRGKPPSGHVTFYVGPSPDPTYINCLGGNQGDMVKCSRYAIADILGYRWPKGYDIDGNREVAPDA